MLFQSQSPEDTQKLARDVLARLNGGDIVFLEGDLGSGKTTFAQGLAQALGIKEPVTSPTFVSMQIYPVKDHPSIKQLCHIDAYRFKDAQDALSTGLTDYYQKPDTLCVIEWPENLFSLKPKPTLTLSFEHGEERTRTIQIEEN